MKSIIGLLCVVVVTGMASGADKISKITIPASKEARPAEPVSILIAVPEEFAKRKAIQLNTGNGNILGQLTEPGLLARSLKAGKGEVIRELHFVLPAGERKEAVWEATLFADLDLVPETAFTWMDKAGEYAELSFGKRPVLRYMYKALDDSSPEKRDLTFKVYHHLYDPDGKRLVTKGPGGLYTHHRGLFFGFNKISYAEGKKQADIWHCRGEVYQSHEKFLAQEAGGVLGRHRLLLHWNNGKEVFAKEERELTVYAAPGGTLLVEFATRVTSNAGLVKLDGDPQHAGFHFRADNEVAEKTKGQTYYLRPDGKGKPGETRNWPAQKEHVNLAWDAMSFVLGEQRYTCVYLDRPTNPKEARFSERDYGRFGSYFVFELDKDKPLELNYRIWLQKGEMTGKEAEALSASFVKPVEVKVK